jgi:hypothetical protein
MQLACNPGQSALWEVTHISCKFWELRTAQILLTFAIWFLFGSLLGPFLLLMAWRILVTKAPVTGESLSRLFEKEM